MAFKWTYLSQTRGVGGRIKEQIEDFIVKEHSLYRLDTDDHLILDLTKYNLTTLDAIKELSNMLYVSQERFGFAGNKDKRAITTQAISIKGVEEEQLQHIFLPNLEIEVKGKGEHINVGQLEGNSFEVMVRNITLPDDMVKKRLHNIHQELNGTMPNYFGMQRFGTVRPITHKVGRELLKGNYETAVWMYLGEAHDNEPERIQKIRRDLAETREVTRGAEKFPAQYRFEKILLYHLANQKEDYLGAIQQLPEGLQKLFIHAYQSYIFNEALSRLIQEDHTDDCTLPLIGYRTHLKKEEPDATVREILAQEDVELQDFKLPDLPHLRTEGTTREAFVPYSNFSIKSVTEDDLNIDKTAARLQFYLPSGSYATTLLREFMKQRG